METEKIDVLVIGGGVAGLSSALYVCRAGLNCIVLDSGKGQTLEISTLENYPGVFPFVNGNDFSESLKKQAEHFGAKINFDEVLSIDKKNNLFYVKSSLKEYCAKAVIYAVGASHKKLEIPGEKDFSGLGVSYCAVCDGPFFKNKTVCVIGGGDSACSEALYLSNIASKVYLVHRRNAFRASDAIVQKVMENKKISVLFNSVPKEIKGDGKVSSIIIENTEAKTKSDVKTDGIFVAVGMIPRTTLLDTLKKDENGYLITNENMSTQVPGLYVVGDVRSKPLRQVVTATSDGAIAGFSAAEYAKNL